MKSYKEGQNIRFKIKKHIELSETEKYFVLEDEFGRKQLLKSEFYENYKFKIGQDLNCRVDHINCSGKIFLEPEHPYYNEGKIYDFIIEKTEVSKNRLGDNVLLISFRDKTGNTASCLIENTDIQDYKTGQKISCKLERIKKGKVYLSPAYKKTEANFKRGEYYKFKISDIKTLKDGFKYYILSDENKKKYLLKHELYRHHNFSTGQIIECTIIKYSSKGYYIPEPKHPYYEIGKEYDFEFLKQEKDIKGNITDNFDISVKDIFGDEVKFISEKSLLKNGSEPDFIRCKVTGIKKGKPLLVVL